jgi:polyisoprenoid-binding protein YceI
MKAYVAITALAALATLSQPCCAQQKLLAEQSEIAFTSRQMGVPVDGKFKSFTAQIAFDPKKLAASSIAFKVDLLSAAIGDAETMAELTKPAWFDSKRLPQASFVSSRIQAAGPGRFDVAGVLTIKGSARDVLVPVTLTQAGGQTSAVGSFAIKRLDFRIGDGDWADTSLVANEVQVKFRFVLTGVSLL